MNTRIAYNSLSFRRPPLSPGIHPARPLGHPAERVQQTARLAHGAGPDHWDPAGNDDRIREDLLLPKRHPRVHRRLPAEKAGNRHQPFRRPCGHCPLLPIQAGKGPWG